MHGHWCPGGCTTLIPPGQSLCASCSLALSKYIDENPAIVEAYAAAGFVEIERSLTSHAAFAAWLDAHPTMGS